MKTALLLLADPADVSGGRSKVSGFLYVMVKNPYMKPTCPSIQSLENPLIKSVDHGSCCLWEDRQVFLSSSTQSWLQAGLFVKRFSVDLAAPKSFAAATERQQE